MNTASNSRRLAAVAALLMFAASPGLAQDEPQVFDAFAAVEANGTIVRAAEKRLMIVGTLAGRFYIETGEGPVDSGRVSCAASARLDRASARTTAHGACTVTTHDGATAWGEWQCDGYELVGCQGTFTLLGGTARFEGAAGESRIIWRPTAHEFSRQLDGSTLDKAAGLLLWRDFKLAKAK